MFKKGFLLFLFSVFFLPATVLAIPSPKGHVNDFEGILDNADALEKRLSDFEKETTIEVSVLTTSDFENTYIEDYAIQVFEKWGIGKEGEDNGVLILVSKEQRESRIEVGYGLEGVLTDSLTGRIQDVSMIPFFKQDNFSEGVESGVEAILAVLDGEEISGITDASDDEGGIWVLGAMLFGFLLLIPSPLVGAIIGFVIGFLLGTAFLGPLPGLLVGILGGFLGFGFGFLAKLIPASTRHAMATAVFHSSNRGGGGGGSFGGFGGGSSGGGGSSRSW
jgi:uncharacterized protein